MLKLADLMVQISGGKVHNEHVSTHKDSVVFHSFQNLWGSSLFICF